MSADRGPGDIGCCASGGGTNGTVIGPGMVLKELMLLKSSDRTGRSEPSMSPDPELSLDIDVAKGASTVSNMISGTPRDFASDRRLASR